MELIVSLGQRVERVRVERQGVALLVTVGATTHRVDRVPAGPGRHSFLIDGEHFEVAVLALDEDSYWVSSRRGGARVEVTDPLTHLAAQGAASGSGRRTERVTAYMPGRVVAVLADEGQQVKAGQGLVVLEAMKMENEIRAEHDGTVRRVCVEEGQAVEGGDVLFELG